MCVIWACQEKHLNLTTRTLCDDSRFLAMAWYFQSASLCSTPMLTGDHRAI
jgi:hypothetical protein